MQVVVLGAGALGSLYGAWAADAGHDVVLVTRPHHAKAVESDGLRIGGRDGSQRRVRLAAVDHAGLAPDADVVLVACKAQDTGRLLADYTGTAQVAWSVQNGALQTHPLVERFGAAALGCASMVGATLAEPGRVQHTFSGRTYIGALGSTGRDAMATLRNALVATPDVVERDDIESVLWSKAVLATGAMGASVLLRVPYHRVFTEDAARDLFYDIVADAASIADGLGIALVDLPGPLQVGSLMHLDRHDALARLAAVGQAMLAAGETDVRVSMLQSLDSGRRLEVDAVFGDLIGVADTLGLDVPLLRTVTRVIRTLDSITADRTEGQ